MIPTHAIIHIYVLPMVTLNIIIIHISLASNIYVH